MSKKIKIINVERRIFAEIKKYLSNFGLFCDIYSFIIVLDIVDGRG
ncbi:hypothetical protein [Thermovenabulum sp.]